MIDAKHVPHATTIEKHRARSTSHFSSPVIQNRALCQNELATRSSLYRTLSRLTLLALFQLSLYTSNSVSDTALGVFIDGATNT